MPATNTRTHPPSDPASTPESDHTEGDPGEDETRQPERTTQRVKAKMQDWSSRVSPEPTGPVTRPPPRPSTYVCVLERPDGSLIHARTTLLAGVTSSILGSVSSALPLPAALAERERACLEAAAGEEGEGGWDEAAGMGVGPANIFAGRGTGFSQHASQALFKRHTPCSQCWLRGSRGECSLKASGALAWCKGSMSLSFLLSLLSTAYNDKQIP
uniref:Uncharacterized protein n=1 Tax=Knipowitschia caucasica TaxID=637954 RepID=A0AAV2J335_KNICA